jgi:NAD(P)-dependent dehydrogenase (short-subunit alcohol dehydrogenase family)
MTLVGGRACVVSGAGRGLGRGIADLFARQGAALALCARGERELQTAADDLRRQHGVEILTAALDVRDAAAVRDFARATEREIGAAYGLVNNAAALGPVGRIDEVDLGDWKRAFEANVVGVANMCAAFAPQMAGAGGGVILNLSGGGIGGPSVPDRVSAYTTAKAGVVMLTETLARELAPSAIRVNAIAPGSQPTGFLRPVLDAGPGAVGDDLYRTAAAMADGPSGEVQDVDDRLAELVLFLLSEESSWLSGRLVSARWDSVERLRAVEKQLRDSSFLTLRRIDGELFRQVDERG